MRENGENTIARWRIALLAPLFSAGLTHCTFGGLNALGAGSHDAGLPSDSGAIRDASLDADLSPDAALSTDVDAFIGSSEDEASPGLDAADADAVDSGVSPVTDSQADAASGVPASALPTWLEAGAPSWCDLHPGYAFCADFDEVPLPAGFSASDGAYLSETSSNPSSGPNDLLLYVPPQATAATWGSKLSRSFETPASTIVLAFDIDPESLNSTSSGILFAALDFLGNASAKYSLRLAFNEGAPRLEESYLGSPMDVFHSNFVLAPQTWSRIQVEISFAGVEDGGAGIATESIYVNGVLQNVPETLTPPVGFDPRASFLLGAVYGTSPTEGWALRFDNVTLDIQ